MDKANVIFSEKCLETVYFR